MIMLITLFEKDWLATAHQVLPRRRLGGWHPTDEGGQAAVGAHTALLRLNSPCTSLLAQGKAEVAAEWLLIAHHKVLAGRGHWSG